MTPYLSLAIAIRLFPRSIAVSAIWMVATSTGILVLLGLPFLLKTLMGGALWNDAVASLPWLALTIISGAAGFLAGMFHLAHVLDNPAIRDESTGHDRPSPAQATRKTKGRVTLQSSALAPAGSRHRG